MLRRRDNIQAELEAKNEALATKRADRDAVSTLLTRASRWSLTVGVQFSERWLAAKPSTAPAPALISERPAFKPWESTGDIEWVGMQPRLLRNASESQGIVLHALLLWRKLTSPRDMFVSSRCVPGSSSLAVTFFLWFLIAKSMWGRGRGGVLLATKDHRTSSVLSS